MSNIPQLNQENFSSTTSSATPVLVDFWAPWCGPCKMMLPILDELSGELSGQASIAKVNVDEQSDLAAQFNINAIPAFIVFKNGKEVDRFVGAQRKDELKRKLLSHA